MKFTPTIITIRDPEWIDRASCAIKCVIRTDHLKGEHIFIAKPDDIEAHGREIFARCVSGFYGPVQETQNASPDFSQNTQGEIFEGRKIGNFQKLETFLHEANFENNSGSLRGIVLVWSSMIEALLYDFLYCQCAARDNHHRRTKNKHVPFSTMIRNISEESALSKLAPDLKAIKEIRNAFAHEWQISLQNEGFAKKIIPHFSHIYVRHYVRDFYFHEDLDFLVRLIFAGRCAEIMIEISRETRVCN